MSLCKLRFSFSQQKKDFFFFLNHSYDFLLLSFESIFNFRSKLHVILFSGSVSILRKGHFLFLISVKKPTEPHKAFMMLSA